MELTNGSSIAGYTIVRQLGSGRTGSVYLADDPQLSRQVALKVLNADISADADFRAQFGRDIDVAVTLDHPNIAAILGHGEADGHLWIASEFVDGIDVGRLVRQHFPTGMTATAVATIVHGAARALDYAHGRQLLHRHVNPSNILIVDPFSDSYRIVLTDFGTSRLRQRVSPRTDQFGLAATATYLLTGRPPSTNTELPLSASHPELAPLDSVFMRAFTKDPAARFTSCRQFAAALARASAADPSTPADALPRPSKDTAKGLKVSRLMPLALAVLAVALLAAIVVFVAVPRLSGSSTAPSGEASPNPSAPPSAQPPTAPSCEAVVNTLSTRDKLAQLLMVGVTGAADARAVVADQHVGGIMVGSWTDLSMLQDGSMPEIAASSGPLPLAVSVDEEGGRVQRLSSIIGSQPPPRTLADTASPDEVYAIALKRGLAMKDLGITVDFAPVVDVTDAPDDTVIGDRSFGSTPETVTTYAGEYARGLRGAGLLPVLKHFPGHGHGSGDSHTGGVSTPSIDELRANDLIPYRTLTTQAPVAVMLGHLQVPGLTGTDPASLSKAAYDLLRSGGYGGPPFTGLVYTDDLSSMAAINQRYGVAEAVLKSLQAGADVALWITTDEVPNVLNSLEQAVNSGQLSLDRVNESAMRVAASKNPGPNCGG